MTTMVMMDLFIEREREAGCPEFGFQHKHVVQSEMLGTGRWNREGGKKVKWKKSRAMGPSTRYACSGQAIGYGQGGGEFTSPTPIHLRQGFGGLDVQCLPLA